MIRNSLKYFILAILLLTLKTSAHNWTQWQEFELICEIRTVKPITYGANEFVKGKKAGGYEICRYGMVTRYKDKS
jgi:hypothetical protein